jgi:hypothetical protein
MKTDTEALPCVCPQKAERLPIKSFLAVEFRVPRVGAAEAIKGALQVSQFVGSKRPVSAPRGDPQSDVAGSMVAIMKLLMLGR